MEEGLLQRLKEHKIIIGIICITLILFGATYLLNTLQKKTPSENSKTLTTLQNPSPSSPTPSAAQWKIYRSTNYSIPYPPDWVTLEIKNTIGGTTFGARPGFLPQGEKYPFLRIQTATIEQVPVQNYEKTFEKVFRFSKFPCTISNISCARYVGIIPLRPNEHHETAVVFQYQKQTYLITFTYLSSQNRIELEDVFQKMLQGFHFNIQ